MRIDQQQTTLVMFVTLIFGISARERCVARLGFINNHFYKEGHFAHIDGRFYSLSVFSRGLIKVLV